MPPLVFALIIFGICLGLALLVIAGKSGKPLRSRAIPSGSQRTRSREEVLHELRLGQVALENAAREAEEGFLKLRAEQERARLAFLAASATIQEVADVA
jgi:hypothetical protein